MQTTVTDLMARSFNAAGLTAAQLTAVNRVRQNFFTGF
jgi:hypothetical protein